MDKKEIKELILWRKNLPDNYPWLERDFWSKIESELTKNENETIEFLKTCTSEELFYLSESFEEISFVFQSREFVDFLKELAKLHPNIITDVDIKWAEDAILD
ncbi:hypothetical protein M2651_00220 [Clostridium sp. SYSU_GA19001]|uniref:hypothetical protein n=1 Tax=Clostridium caldaquaticum TaxID=2940653 RepID=UPI002076E7C5|nr:hypothetical protein [Clostridium caldaquaticum]MCM8709449.1 hypothetical protein [Clostridium caldaquaticum]